MLLTDAESVARAVLGAVDDQDFDRIVEIS